MDQDPAPALTRGLALLRLLEQDGRCSLEQLVASSGFPKTSVLRLLASLEQAGAVGRDPLSKRYRALQRLVPCDEPDSRLRLGVAEVLPALAEATAATAELYVWGDTMVMVDRCEAEGQQLRIQARIGFRRDLSELDALGQIACVWGGHAPAPQAWAYVAGRPKRLSLARRRELLTVARAHGVARDNDLNGYGVLRLAAPLLAADGSLLGALAIARSWVPDAAASDRAITSALRSHAERATTALERVR
jgi:DNA-binding IclR family transcriptional regulator